MQIDRLDHLVLTVRDIDASIDFYTRVLGMRAVTFGAGRKALASVRRRSTCTRPGRIRTQGRATYARVRRPLFHRRHATEAVAEQPRQQAVEISRPGAAHRRRRADPRCTCATPT